MLEKCLKWLAIGIGIALAFPVDAVESNLYLVALAGQSNMTGAGDVKLLPVGFPKNRTRIWNFTNAYTWELAKEPVDSIDHQVDEVSRDRHPGVGPGLAMADAFTAKYPSVKVGAHSLRERREQHRAMAARLIALVALRFVSQSAKAG